ncbi:MAG: cell division protein ZapA [Ruminococcus sp.]|jgi:cell division protein ZapA|nr:cell division protein ZapA [Ruminococcus sp.]
MNKMKISVCGKEYKLNTDSSEEDLRALAASAERTITEFMSQARLSVQDAAVLAALDAYAEADKHSKSVDNIRIQLQEYISEAARARAEIDEAAKSKENLKKKQSDTAKTIETLEKKIRDLNKDIEERDRKISDFDKEKADFKKSDEDREIEITRLKERIDVLEKENEDLWKFKLEENA